AANGGRHDDGDIRKIADDLPQELNAAQAGHLHVQQGKTELLFGKTCKSFLSIGRGNAYVTFLKAGGKDFAHGLFVVNDKNAVVALFWELIVQVRLSLFRWDTRVNHSNMRDSSFTSSSLTRAYFTVSL